MDYTKYVTLSDDDLVKRTAGMITIENQCVTHQIALIALIDRRRIHLRKGHGDLARYLEATFGLTYDQSITRARVARAVMDFPQVLEPLSRGETTLTNLSLAAPRLTHANCEVLLNGIKGISKRNAMQFVRSVQADGTITDPPPVKELRINCEPALLDAIERLKEVLSSKGNNVSVSDALATAVEDCLDRRDPMRKAERAEKRRQESGKKSSGGNPETEPSKVAAVAGMAAGKAKDDHHFARKNPWPKRIPIPMAAKHAVTLRDGGRCTYVGEDGHRCEERKMLEHDHKVPVYRGGDNSVENVRLRCRAHNQFTAESLLGSWFMARKRGDARPPAEIKWEPLFKAALVPDPLDMRELGLAR